MFASAIVLRYELVLQTGVLGLVLSVVQDALGADEDMEAPLVPILRRCEALASGSISSEGDSKHLTAGDRFATMRDFLAASQEQREKGDQQMVSCRLTSSVLLVSVASLLVSRQNTRPSQHANATYTWGHHRNSALGHNQSPSIPTLSACLSELHPRMVVAGHLMTLAISRDGHLYACGSKAIACPSSELQLVPGLSEVTIEKVFALQHVLVGSTTGCKPLIPLIRP